MKLPEPVAWQWLDTAHFIRKKVPKTSITDHWNPLYSADQMKAVRREALKEAANICFVVWGDRKGSESGTALECAATIRALIEECGNETA
jgi:hypothetical protein